MSTSWCQNILLNNFRSWDWLMESIFYITKSLCHGWRVLAATPQPRHWSTTVNSSRSRHSGHTTAEWGGREERRLPAQRAHGSTSRLSAAAFIAVRSCGARYGLKGSSSPKFTSSPLKLPLSTAATRRRTEGTQDITPHACVHKSCWQKYTKQEDGLRRWCVDVHGCLR